MTPAMTRVPNVTARPSVAYLYVICLLLVAGTVSWRRGVYFTGAFDVVVILKAGISGLALLLALYTWRQASNRTELGPRTVVIGGTYLAVTCLGGLAAGSGFASAVVAVRVALIAASLLLLLSTFELDQVMGSLVHVFGAVAAVSIITGLASVGQGRLEGGIPPLSPNELAFMCGTVALHALHRVVAHASRPWDWPVIVALLLVVWLTGSRTGVATLMLAMVLMLLQARRLSVPAFISLVVGVPVLAFVATSTSTVGDLLSRGGAENVTTLSSRTIAWQAALQMDMSFWQRWFGGGLAMKHVPVTGQYWSDQLLDSSWISALVQGGLVGITLYALWTLGTVIAAVRSPRPWRPLWTGLLVFVVGRSFLESGLLDASTPFLVFITVSAMSEKGPRASLARRQASGHGRQRSPLSRDVARMH
jgi:hypothetical protein